MSDRKDFIAGLREAATWFEQHPDVKVPNLRRFSTYFYDFDEFKAQVKAAGSGRKDISTLFLNFEVQFSGGIELHLAIAKEFSCQQVKVGERVIPASEEQVEPVYEWVCPESYLAP